MSYLSLDQLLQNDYSADGVVLVGNSSYDENAIILNINESNSDELFACALNMSIIGVGNGEYGSVSIDGEVYEIKDIFRRNGVLMKSREGANLSPGDLTPKRIVRIFRAHINQYLRENDVSSYLYRKYAAGEGDRTLIFPGAEHLIDADDSDNLIALYNAYKNLDELKSSTFAMRIKEVYMARGIDISILD